ncbi:MAG: hypothetical protein K0V04_41895 [Deltaproteobacteria bacterium]|nr:hypothetical protein [Deltaproteobacteria bacterium]
MRTLCGTTLALALALTGGCKNEGSTVNPDQGSNLVGDFSDDTSFGDDEFGLDDDDEALEDDGAEVAVEELPPLPKRAKATKKCKGKGKKRVCGMVDPKPKVSASYGTRKLKGDFRWGMSTRDVFKLLSREIEAEYTKRQDKASGDAMAQDAARNWRAEELQDLQANHIRFKSASKHRWGVSLIQYEYEDDTDEEMLWIKANPTLRKYYFFRDGELWKIFYAYSPDTWKGKPYADVVEEKFKKWFGVSPESKVKQDPKTAEPLVRYFEWTSSDGDRVRSFDMTQVHGVIGLAVLSAGTEDAIGERLPNVGRDDSYTDVVNDVLGGSDVCYDDDGGISECNDSDDSL